MSEPFTREPSTSQATPSFSAEKLEDLETVWIWGLPFARLDRYETIEAVERLIRRGEPSFFITANVQYAMLCDGDPCLAEVNRQAAFLVADGMPIVWYSQLLGRRLPERVAGSDLIYLLARRAAERGHRVFFVGGKPGVAAAAATVLSWRYPGLQIAGVEAPELESLSAEEHQRLVERIREAHADLLLAALGQPKGELWLAANYRALGVPVSVQVGATFDFVAGRAARAPRWMQAIGLEWFHRMCCDPKRLVPRYARNASFLIKAVLRDLIGRRRPAASCSASASEE
jgi:N-acetylglucosaminyldiphosphoundecaprenol N-acetyl-beta-D-mannosaminyltransferase